MTAATVEPVKVPATVEVKKAPPMKSSHPSTSEMVNSAISTLKDKKGSSLQAIKKFIGEHYTVDVDKQASFIKRYLKSAIEKKTILTKGTGLTGRFKLAEKSTAAEKKPAKQAASDKKPTEKKSVEKKTAAPKKVEETSAKDAGKKPATEKKPTSAKKSVAKKVSSPSKVKKSGKSPAAMAKSPKPKTTGKKVTAK